MNRDWDMNKNCVYLVLKIHNAHKWSIVDIYTLTSVYLVYIHVIVHVIVTK